MKPLTKTNWANLPLSIPVEWKSYFEETAQILGGSRNQVMCMALKLGGPILGKYVEVMRSNMQKHCAEITHEQDTCKWPSEILGATEGMNGRANIPVDEPKHTKPGNRAGSRKSGRSQKGA